MTDDFFRARLDQMIDLKHPLAVLAQKMPWSQIEKALAPLFSRKAKEGQTMQGDDLFGQTVAMAGGISNAGRPKLSIRLMASLLYLKHANNLSDEALVERWSENVVWQYFSGMDYYEPRLPCDATQIGRFRTAIGEAGVEELLKATIDAAVQAKAIKPAEFERVIVDSTVQEKAIAHPVDSRLLEIARHKVVQAAKNVGVELKQTFAKEGKELRRRAGGYAHAKQFRRMKKVVNRQRTILGILLREVGRKLPQVQPESPFCQNRLTTILEQAERIRTQQPKDKGNPYDGHVLSAQLEQTTILLEDIGKKPKEAVVDLGYRGVDDDNPGVNIIHRGKYRSLTKQQRRWLKRRSAIEPAIGHLKSDNRLDRCYLKGELGDALHAVLCAAGYNIRWLMRAMLRLGLKAVLLRLNFGRLLTALMRSMSLEKNLSGHYTHPRMEIRVRQMNFAGATI